jgi:hypothetical protein
MAASSASAMAEYRNGMLRITAAIAKPATRRWKSPLHRCR